MTVTEIIDRAVKQATRDGMAKLDDVVQAAEPMLREDEAAMREVLRAGIKALARDRLTFEHRMRAMTELAGIAVERARIHETLAQRHAEWWLGDWERQKSHRLDELARIIGDPELHALIRETPALRALFSRDVPPPLPKLARTANHRRSRAKPRPVEDGLGGLFDLGKWPWPDWSKL
jgi:hypothetical protein